MRTPWHVWVVGIVSLIWNGGGAFDYLMTQHGNEAYLSMLTEPQRAMLDARPGWFDAAWALGVWGAVLGSVLILLRSGWSQLAFMLSLVGLAGSSGWSFALSTPPAQEVMGSFAVIFSAVVFVVLLLLWAYTRAMTARNILR